MNDSTPSPTVLPRLYSLTEVRRAVGGTHTELMAYVYAGLLVPQAVSSRGYLFSTQGLDYARAVMKAVRAQRKRTERRYYTPEQRAQFIQHLKERYLKGFTLEEIGLEVNLTRERVRQYLASVGVAQKDGGRAVRTATRSATEHRARVVSREAYCQKHYGCSWDQYCQLGLSTRLWRMYSRGNRVAYSFGEHVRAAQAVQVPWGLTLPQYVGLVRPYLEQSPTGRRATWVLGRKEKTGAFTLDNVEVLPLAENSFRTQQQARKRKLLSKLLELDRAGFSLRAIRDALRPQYDLSIHTVRIYLYAARNRERHAKQSDVAVGMAGIHQAKDQPGV